MVKDQLNLRIDPKVIEDLETYCAVFGRHKTRTVEDWIKLGILLEINPTLREVFNQAIKEQNFELKIKIPDEVSIVIENYDKIRDEVIKPTIDNRWEEIRPH